VLWPHVLAGTLVVINLLASAHAMLLKRDTRSTIGWVGLIWFSPGIGAALYAIFGVNRIRGEDGRISRVRYVLPRHKAANWVGPGRGRKSTRPDASGAVELSPCDFLDRLADLVPPPRKHRHRYHGVFAPNHKLRSAVTAHDKRECRQAA
jgi:cardiolipin synthase